MCIDSIMIIPKMLKFCINIINKPDSDNSAAIQDLNSTEIHVLEFLVAVFFVRCGEK